MAQTGFTASGAERQREVESRALAAIDPGRFAELAGILSAAPHIAGSPGQAAFRDTLVARLSAWGYEPEVASYWVYLPWATEVSLSIVAPDVVELEPVEGPVPGAAEPDGPRYPTVNGYSGSATSRRSRVRQTTAFTRTTRGSPRAGSTCAGRSRSRATADPTAESRRGWPRSTARSRSSSTPIDRRRLVPRRSLPEGPWRRGTGVQRGSVKNGEGDPTTPDGPA